VLVSLIAAVLAALCYGVASVMQAVAVREASGRSQAQASQGGLDAGLVPRMLHQWRFVVSMVIDLLGFIAQLVALHRLPLFAVQAIVAANLAVIAVLASVVIGATLSLREWLAVGGVVAGVGLLGSSAGAEGATTAGGAFKIALIIATAALGVAGMIAARVLRDPARTLVLGTVAGFGFGAVGIAARVLRAAHPAARPGGVRGRGGGHRVVRLLRHRARGRQRDRRHLGGGPRRDAAAGPGRRAVPGRHDPPRPHPGGGGGLPARGRERGLARPVRRGREPA
jgi:drug/metabolite transporter (DMT)-like permease